MKRQVGSYDEDNSETARFEGDDVGLPESPIYSNFSKHLWTGHARLGGVQTSDRFRENAGDRGPQLNSEATGERLHEQNQEKYD